MLWLVLLSCSLVLSNMGQPVNREWVDPFDMLNYDPSTKTMKNSESQTNGAADPQQREKANQPVPHCNQQVTDLQKQIGKQKNQIKIMSQQLSCTSVFKRFLNRLLNEVNRFGGIGGFILIVIAIICTEMWSVVSWFLQVTRMFMICFFVSIIWNWFYLYKIAFAKHKNNLVKMDKDYAKCSGLKEITWIDSVKEWYRSTWTLQDDPCKEYHEVLMVNPILLVPPMKAITMTITTFITEPLKHFGQGISEFLRALLKDLPVTLQIPVLIVITLSILVLVYGTVQAVFRHGILAPFRRPQRETPHPVIEQPQLNPRRIEDQANDEVRAQPPLRFDPRDRANNARVERNHIHQRRGPVSVETLRSARTEVDSPPAGAILEEERTSAVTEPENQQSEPAKDVEAGGDAADTAQSKPKKNQSNSEQSKSPQLKDFSGMNPNEEDAADNSEATERQPAEHEVQDAGAPADDATTSALLRQIETVGTPVEDVRPTDGL
uniref:Chloride channel CLIC-like protein 1 n=1 Tax=Oryzias latipes TaxID=8090 RepID=A0A3B3ICK4_ORYLA